MKVHNGTVPKQGREKVERKFKKKKKKKKNRKNTRDQYGLTITPVSAWGNG